MVDIRERRVNRSPRVEASHDVFEHVDMGSLPIDVGDRFAPHTEIRCTACAITATQLDALPAGERVFPAQPRRASYDSDFESRI